MIQIDSAVRHWFLSGAIPTPLALNASEGQSHPALLVYASLGRCVGERQAHLDCPIKVTGVSIRSLLRLALPRHLRRFMVVNLLEGLNR